ncbi:MAG: alpha/beta hydrolase [Acidobacteriota bacterium]|nr:MAG: alpha/beta hydrolase [Acidobacteriota bacterium]
MIRRLFTLLLLLSIPAGYIAWQWYSEWKTEVLREISASSRVADTAAGPIEYGSRGEGQAILISHPTPGGFDLIMRSQLRLDGFRLLVPSRPGYLRTPLSVGATPEEQANAFRALLDHFGIDRAAVLGIGGGGPAAIQFALRHRNRCRALILVSAVTHRMSEERRVTPAEKFLATILETDFGVWAFSGILTSQFQDIDTSDQEVRTALTESAKGLVPWDERKLGRANDFMQFDRLPDYPFEDIRLPVLILHGTEDKAIPYTHARVAFERIPGAKLYPFQDGDQYLLLTRFREIQAAISAFL